MIQLDFDAANPGEALAQRPTKVGYSQHEGAEEATWGDDKLHLVDGTHPVVYPAAGSHANFYGDGLFLGSSAEQGVGCDNTNGPHDDLRPAVATIPSDPAARPPSSRGSTSRAAGASFSRPSSTVRPART